MTTKQTKNAILFLCTALAGQLWADAPAKLVSVRIMPTERTLHGKKASQQFLVLGKFADNRESDITGQAHFALSNSAPARADESGRVFAVADGETILTASVSGFAAKASLKIEAQGRLQVDRGRRHLPGPDAGIDRRKETASRHQKCGAKPALAESDHGGPARRGRPFPEDIGRLRSHPGLGPQRRPLRNRAARVSER